jgi:BASS family bile acid:Na+ symporter
VLAQRHFPAEPLTAVPCAISSVVHSVIGSTLAGWWRLRAAPAVTAAAASTPERSPAGPV